MTLAETIDQHCLQQRSCEIGARRAVMLLFIDTCAQLNEDERMTFHAKHVEPASPVNGFAQ